MASSVHIASNIPTEAEAPLGGPTSPRKPGVPLLPWSFVGMGVFISWLSLTHLRGGFVFVDGAGSAGTLVDYLMRVGDIGTLLACAVLANRIGRLSKHRSFCIVAVALGTLGTLLAPVALHLGSPALLAAASVCAGAGGAVALLLWAEAYSQIGPARCLVFGALSCMLAGVIAFVGSSMAYWRACLVIGLLLPASAIMAGVSLSRLPAAAQPSSPVAETRRASYPVPWKLVLLMALAGFASGFAGSILSNNDAIGALHRIEATALFGLLALVLLFARRGDADIRWLARCTLPLVVASLVLIPLAPPAGGVAVSFLVKYSYVAFALFALATLANVCYRHDIPSLRVFASARAASEAAMFAGIILRRQMQASGAFGEAAMMWAVSVVGLVAVVACVLLWHSERAVTSDWGATGIDPASGLQVKSARGLLFERLDDLSERCGLTPREKDVLTLLAQGHDYAEMEDELFVSHNTLKTHVHHIYAKTGVHSRRELLELFGTNPTSIN